LIWELIIFDLFQNVGYGRLKRAEVILCDVTNFFRSYLVVPIQKSVLDIGELLPGNTGMPFFDIPGDISYRFAYVLDGLRYSPPRS